MAEQLELSGHLLNPSHEAFNQRVGSRYRLLFLDSLLPPVPPQLSTFHLPSPVVHVATLAINVSCNVHSPIPNTVDASTTDATHDFPVACQSFTPHPSLNRLQQVMGLDWLNSIHYYLVGGNVMPTVFFYGPELEKDKKRELIKSFTEAASQATGIDKSAFVVYLRRSTAEDVGVGGELLADRQKKS